jgi:hypothetical protein
MGVVSSCYLIGAVPRFWAPLHETLDATFEATPRDQDIALTVETFGADIHPNTQNAPQSAATRVGFTELHDIPYIQRYGLSHGSSLAPDLTS